MDALTHALASYALARTVLPKPARSTVLLVVAAGLAPDLDLLSNLAGPSLGMRLAGAATHSLLGAGIIVVSLAVGFWAWARRSAGGETSLLVALALALLGVAAHLLLDLMSSYGAALLWPFRSERTPWDLMLPLDPIVLSILLFTLLLPGLFRMVSEEIGARTERRAARGWATAAIAGVVLLAGARFFLHARAVTLLENGRYHDRPALHAAAFADSANPFHWRGVAETETSIEELEVPVGPGAEFDADRSRSFYKPEASPALDAARQAPGAARFLSLARFPNASVERTADGWRVELRDIGMSAVHDAQGYFVAAVELDTQAHVLREELEYTRERAR